MANSSRDRPRPACSSHYMHSVLVLLVVLTCCFVKGCNASFWPRYNSLAGQFLYGQNIARARLGEPPLIWDNRLAAYAQWWANTKQASGDCYLQHSGGPYGENVFWGRGKPWSPAEAVAAWVDERRWYDYYSNSCLDNDDCGHYTQIVWRNTRRVGCARTTCANGDVFMTCNYDPPGNYIGERPY